MDAGCILHDLVATESAFHFIVKDGSGVQFCKCGAAINRVKGAGVRSNKHNVSAGPRGAGATWLLGRTLEAAITKADVERNSDRAGGRKRPLNLRGPTAQLGTTGRSDRHRRTNGFNKSRLVRIELVEGRRLGREGALGGCGATVAELLSAAPGAAAGICNVCVRVKFTVLPLNW